jgi:transcription elongation GreA/GreB family factor
LPISPQSDKIFHQFYKEERFPKMDKKTIEEMDVRFNELIDGAESPVEEVLAMLPEVPVGKADEWTVKLISKASSLGDFTGLVKVLTSRCDKISGKIKNSDIGEMLKKATTDRLLTSFIDSIKFEARPLVESMGRLNRLMSFTVGSKVLSEAWGVGEIKRLDYFYRRIYVDFRQRKGHQFTFDSACETLILAPADHILVMPSDVVKQMIAERAGDFVKEMIRCYGKLSIVRLEELAVSNGFIASKDWKAFWDRARTDLRKDKRVEIPVRRTDPIIIKEEEEQYGASWMTSFVANTDPKEIISLIGEYEAAGKMKTAELTDETKEKISNRLNFASLATRGTDIATFCKIAFLTVKFGFEKPSTAEMRQYIMADERYLDAARSLPARDVKALLEFLMGDEATKADIRETLFNSIPEMNLTFVSEMIAYFAKDEGFRTLVGSLLGKPDAPATLITYVSGHRKEFAQWAELPPLIVILSHAIALGEGRQNGEKLRMQNMIRRLFSDQNWIETVIGELPAADRVRFFERFQASIAWDHSTHHLITVRMTKAAPELKQHVIVKESAPVEIRVTSIRSYAEREEAYNKLINEEIPKNAQDIEVARGYGDLRENFEYQSAKDEQRVLLQKQEKMEAELKAVKATDFANIASDQVRAGTTVVVTLASGEDVSYTILGEWDNEPERNIISCKTKLATNMLGKKAGETFEISDAEGNVSVATVKSINALSSELLDWIKTPVKA